MLNAGKLLLMSVVLVVANGASALDSSKYTCAAWPSEALATEICAISKATGQCTLSWSFEDDNATKSKQKAAMDDCQRALGNVVTSWNPANYTCAVYPNAAFPQSVCAKSKATGQCTTSWYFSNDDINKSKQADAMDDCKRHLGLVVTKWNPANYTCVVYPNAAFPQSVCAKSKATGQCTTSWEIEDEDINKSKQKEAMAKCEAFLN